MQLKSRISWHLATGVPSEKCLKAKYMTVQQGDGQSVKDVPGLT